MEPVDRINKYLIDQYGLSFDRKPKFRLVWSDDLIEHRKGLHGEVAVFETVEEVPKYSFVEKRWILEVYTIQFPGIFGKSIDHRAEIVMNPDGYEPLRIFQTRKGDKLEPDLEVCKIICDAFLNLVSRPEAQRLTKKQAKAEDVEKMRKESAKFFELINANDSDLMAQFHDKEAVIIHRSE